MNGIGSRWIWLRKIAKKALQLVFYIEPDNEILQLTCQKLNSDILNAEKLEEMLKKNEKNKYTMAYFLFALKRSRNALDQQELSIIELLNKRDILK